MSTPLFFSPRQNNSIAYHRFIGSDAALPGVIWLGGFRSDMTGTKAVYLEDQCKARGQSYIRFDYTGHGSSSGKFEDGCISSWLQDATDVFDALTTGPQILVGSSMGGWIALLLARLRPDRVAGVLGLAAAPDFSRDIYDHAFTDAQRAAIKKDGALHVPSAYGDPYPLTQKLFDDAETHILLDKITTLPMPIHLIQGKKDPDVHWQKAEKIKKQIASRDFNITYIDDGDHRLSRPEDLALIGQTLMELNKRLVV